MISTVISFFIVLLTHAVAGIHSSALKYGKKTTCIVWGTWIVFHSAFLFYAEFCVDSITLRFFLGFILTIISQYIVYFLTTRGRLAQRIFTMLTYSIFFCICTTLLTIVNTTLSDKFSVLPVLIQAAMYFAIMSYFLRYVCTLCRSAGKNITTGWAPLIFVNVVFLIAVVLTSVFPVRLASFSHPSFVAFVFLSVSIMAVYPVVFSNISNMSEAAEKREVELQNKMLIAQIDAESAKLEADSRARHDRRHHNLVMLEFANKGDIDSVKQYLSGLLESENLGSEEEKYCDNSTVQTVLAVYERRAKESGISVKISAEVSRKADVLPRDFVVVIANLFENAIHGVQKAKTKEKVIEISVKENSKRVLIRVDNPCKGNLAFDETCYGVGIRSIISTVDKYDGMYDFSSKNGIFTAKISLNLK